MSNPSVAVAEGTPCAVSAGHYRPHRAGPGDDDDDETPIGDPPDDDGDDDGDDDDDDDDDDEEPLQASILRCSIATRAPSRHNDGPIRPPTVARLPH